MKKLVSIMLIAVILMSAMSVSTFAEVPPEDKFYDRFVEKYGDAMYYQEVQPHYDENNEIDWVVVCAYTAMAVVDVLPDADHYNCYENGEFVFHEKDLYAPFTTQHCVYDPKKDEFIDITKVNFDEYKDLKKHVRTYYFANLIGDVDDDNDVTILDATEIQLILAKLKEQYVGICVSDFDRDDELTVLDATAVQLKLAGLDNEPVDDEEFVIYTLSDYNERWNLPYMSDDATLLSFEMEYDKQQFSDVVYNYEVTGEYYTLAIIKSNEQYNTLFNDRAPKYDDEFFETKWLVMAMTRCGCHQAKAPITDVAVSSGGDTLYVRANIYVPDGPVSPTEPMWLSMVSIDKSELLNVKNIAKVK